MGGIIKTKFVDASIVKPKGTTVANGKLKNGDRTDSQISQDTNRSIKVLICAPAVEYLDDIAK